VTLATRWSSDPYSFGDAHAIAAEVGVSATVASILVRRGHRTPDAARRFLAADERHDPALLVGSDALDLILRHVGGRITVHGDYDVDGVCATAVLVRGLRAVGAKPRWHLPAREDGYGLSRATVERLAADGTDLVVTVDCGIAAIDEVEHAQTLDMDVVVTDHHLAGERLPPCPIVHPAVAGYPCAQLCGTAVAHKLVEALLARAGVDPALAADDLDLVALATVADVVPLLGENRRLVREGIAALARTRKPGLRALMRVSRCDGAVDEHAIGFRLAPRLNAAGRLRRADAALELVTCEDERRAGEVADELDLLNRERQDTETRILFAAEAARSERPDDAAYVLAADGWHPGVIGIVAGRLVERYHRPCVVIALDGDTGRGSGRSIGAYDLHAGLAACAPHLRRFGGHRAAAGLEIDRERVPVLREALVRHAGSVLSPDDLVPVERVDAVVGTADVSVRLAEELERLAPFGHGNPRPKLLIPAARVADVRSMGEDGQHARCRLVGSGCHARAVAFRTSARALEPVSQERSHVVVSLELNEWMGAVEPRLVLRAVCDRAPTAVAALDEEDFWAAFNDELTAPLEHPGAAAGDRIICDRRGTGFAALASDLASTAEPLLVVCADVARRRAAIEQVVASAGPAPALTDWDALCRVPSLAEPYRHVVALDPPSCREHQVVLEHACGSGFVHLAWGLAEVEFARSLAERTLNLRPALAELYRDLRDAGEASEDSLAALLRGHGPYSRSPRQCARLVRVLTELGLVTLDLERRSCRVVDIARTELERSPTYRAHRARHEEAHAYLDGCLAEAA
jgi:single-stranded-DNA-specific exonuclease